MRQLYWCDMCYKDIVVENDEINRIYFSCYSNQQWASHLKSKKHQKFCIKVEDDENNIKCKYCNKDFTKEGYEIHKQRNEKLWKFKSTGGFKDTKCNNFFTKAKRYESFNDYLIGCAHGGSKPKVRRTPVGKISPITGVIRPPNKYGSGALLLNDNYLKCLECNGYDNNSNYSDDEFVVVFNKILCSCPPPTFTKVSPPICERKKDSIEMTIEEIDHTERPEFYDYCLECGCGIKDNDISSKIYDKWDMDYCECESDDEE